MRRRTTIAIVVLASMFLITALSLSSTHDRTHSQEGPASIYSDGYDGSDLRAMHSAWISFRLTEGLTRSEQQMHRYWFRIEVNQLYRIVSIYPKATYQEFDPQAISTHWTFGTEGKFWVHKATFEVDKKQVVPPHDTGVYHVD